MARSTVTFIFILALCSSGNLHINPKVKCDKPTNSTSDAQTRGALRPGMKLGMNHRGGHKWSLSSSSITPEAFTLSWDPKGRELYISRGESIYWRSGVFKNGSFEFITSTRYNFTIVSNKTYDYITYSVVDQTERVSEWLLNDVGDLYDSYTSDVIARVSNCDGYKTDGGCYRRPRPADCMAKSGYEFQIEYAFCQPPSSSSRNLNWFLSNAAGDEVTDQCKAACWKDCNCVGFDYEFENKTGCRFWSVECQFSVDRSGPGIEISFIMSSLTSVASPSPRSINQARKWIRIGTAIVSALLVTLVFISLYLLIRRALVVSGRNGTNFKEFLTLVKPNRPTDGDGFQNDRKIGHDISVFSYRSVLAATRNFSDENKLGEGGFGSVYQGKLVTGQEIAVKKLSKYSEQGALEFKNELILVYELQHTNLVRLFGFCIHGQERMLIYEYMPNKSLDYYLFDSTRCLLLDWKMRFDIIEGIAQGLLYLHKYSRMRVIHRDIKASNVLLDESMNPKISDFGMAKSLSKHSEMEANTNRVAGTYGYMSPEYVLRGNFSAKSDVYSFGVLMLEIISGRKNNSFYNDDRVLTLVGYAYELWKEGAGLELMNPTLAESCNKDQLLRCVHVGLLCVEENAADRPTMSDVISMLTSESSPLRNPLQPAFSTKRNVIIPSGIGAQEPKFVSNNGLSISDLVAR